MSIYKYSLIKFLKSASTWIIMGLSFALLFGVISLLILLSGDSDPGETNARRLLFVLLLPFFVVIEIIFITVTGCKVYRDEIDNGTFLTILSKPYTRGKILIWKILAYFTINILFLLVSVAGLTIPITILGRDFTPAIGSVDTTLKHDVVNIFGTFLLTGFIVLLIMSSLVLLISSRIRPVGTIGIGFSIAVLIQFSGFFSVSVNPAAYSEFVTSKERLKEQLDSNAERFLLAAPEKVKYMSFVTKMVDAIYSDESVKLIDGNREEYKGGKLGTSAIRVNDNPLYNKLSYLDLNYQIKQLGAVSYKNDDSQQESPLESPKKQVTVSTYDQTTGIEMLDNINKILTDGNQYILENFPTQESSQNLTLSWYSLTTPISPGGWPIFALDPIVEQLNVDNYNNSEFSNSERIQMMLFGQAQPDTPDGELPVYTPEAGKKVSILSTGGFAEIKYVDYINKYGLLATYLAISIVLIPLTFIILKRSDFK